MHLSRRAFVVLAALVGGAGAMAVARRSVPEEPLATDPDGTQFVYRDRWIVRAR